MNNKDFFSGKTILITGNTGFKGCYLSYLLHYYGAKVIGYARGIKEQVLYNTLDIKNKVIQEYGDICDYENIYNVIKKHKPDIVIHMAAQCVLKISVDNPRETYKINVLGTVNVLKSIVDCNCKVFLNITTDKVYKNFENKIVFKETDELKGADPYSSSKSCSELVTYSFYKTYFEDNKKLNMLIARAGNTIGGGRFLGGTLLIDCVNNARENKKINIRFPEAVRPYQYVLDVLMAYINIIKQNYNKTGVFEAYNVGPQKEEYFTNGEIVDIFCKYWPNSSWNKVDNYLKEDQFIFLDNTKLVNDIKFKNVYTTYDTIKYTTLWYLNYYNNVDMKKYTEDEIKMYLKKYEGIYENKFK